MVENNVVQLRRNPFKVGNKVYVGESQTTFEVVGLGVCHPSTSEFLECKGELVNSDEFVQLRVPGTERSVFNIHSSFLRRAE